MSLIAEEYETFSAGGGANSKRHRFYINHPSPYPKGKGDIKAGYNIINFRGI